MTLTELSLQLPTFLVTDLTHLLADPSPRPFYIDPDNRNAGPAGTLDEALASGRPFALTVASDVLAFDADDLDRASKTEHLALEIASRGWPVLRVASGRPGHLHLWAVVPDDRDRAHIVHRADLLGAPRPRTVMRPPGAPHRLGLTTDLLDDVEAFIAHICAARQGRYQGITWRDTLRHGKHNGKDQSGSATVWMICIGAIREGLTFDQVRTLLIDPAHRGGAGYRHRVTQMSQERADHWLTKHVWPSAQEAARRLPPADATEARERLTLLSEAIEAHGWHGKAGATDRAVLCALVAYGQRRGSLTPEMSYRQIAEAAPCSLRTVSASVRRLRESGWLLVAEKGRGITETTGDGSLIELARATRWRLVVPAQNARTFHTGGTPPASTSLDVASTRAPSFVDVGRWGGLGLNAPRVLDLLSGGPLTAREIAESLHLNLGNLRARLLPKLAGHRLIEKVEDVWKVSENVDEALVECAEALNLTGKADRVKARHVEDRAAYLDHRETTRPERQRRQRDRVEDRLSERRDVPTLFLDVGSIDSEPHETSQIIIEVGAHG